MSRWWWWVAAAGCTEPPTVPDAPGTAGVAFRALGLTDEACNELDSARFVQGGQGGYHALIGVFGEAPTPDVVMHASVTDAETGELVAELHDFNVMLADWSDDDFAGWASQEARIGDGSGSSENHTVACRLVGRALEVEGSIRPLGSDEPSSVTTTVVGAFDGPCE